jgi:hypothetical protein
LYKGQPTTHRRDGRGEMPNGNGTTALGPYWTVVRCGEVHRALLLGAICGFYLEREGAGWIRRETATVVVVNY